MTRKDELHVRDYRKKKKSWIGEDRPLQQRPTEYGELNLSFTWVNCRTYFFARPGQYIVEAGEDELTIWGPLPDRITCRPEPETVESE